MTTTNLANINPPGQVPAAYAPMLPYRQWGVWTVLPDGSKQPIDFRTGRVPVKGQGGTESWCDYETAASTACRLGSAYGVCFHFTESDPFVFVDIDGGWDGDRWSPIACEIYGMFPGALWETSVSGRGLHGFFLARGSIAPHGCKNGALRIELYDRARWAALTFQASGGSAAADCTEQLAALVARYFPPPASSDGIQWQDGPDPAWSGSSNDNELIEQLLADDDKRGLMRQLTKRAAFRAMWLNPDATCAENFNEDRSRLDAAVAKQLIYGTGGDCPRVERLMLEQWAGVRDKLERRSESYLRPTIAKALSLQRKDGRWFNDGRKPRAGCRFHLEQFYAYGEGGCIYLPTGRIWSAAEVDARVPWIKSAEGKALKPSLFLAQTRSVEQISWVPGLPQIIEDSVIDGDGGLIEKPGTHVFNLYRPPLVEGGNVSDVEPWLAHTRFLYPDDAAHIVRFLAFAVQHPGRKINHALFLGGAPGTGKDTILEPLRYAIGCGNFGDINPEQIFDNFTPWVRSVVLRVNEVKDLGERSRFQFYNRTKGFLAAPPVTLTCNEKHVKQYAVPNVCKVVMTSNFLEGGIYLPPDDRRHYIAWSERTKDSFGSDAERGTYFLRLYQWYERGGFENVAAYLASLDISDFNSAASPPHTNAFQRIVLANQLPEEADLAETLEQMGRPAVVTLPMLQAHGNVSLKVWIDDRSKRRHVPERMKVAGYAPVPNTSAKDGLWRIGGKRLAVYGRDGLQFSEQRRAAEQLAGPRQ